MRRVAHAGCTPANVSDRAIGVARLESDDIHSDDGEMAMSREQYYEQMGRRERGFTN